MRTSTWSFDGKQYLVYENGNIYGPTGIPLKYRPNQDGYPTVTVGREKRTRKTVHSIVAETFIPRPNDPDPNHKYEIDHLDGDRTNFSVDNLEWVLHRENTDRATANFDYSIGRNSSGRCPHLKNHVNSGRAAKTALPLLSQLKKPDYFRPFS